MPSYGFFEHLKMVQVTSWNGTATRALKNQGLKNFYTRYADRRNKLGKQIVVPRGTHLDIYDSQGRFIGREAKYHHFNSYEKTAQNTYNKEIRKQFNRLNKVRGQRIRVR